jgi:RNA polymerase sigma-70 factor (ECF subfamily)
MADDRAYFLARYSRSISHLAHRGGADRWNLPTEALSEAIYASVSAWAQGNLFSVADDRVRAYLDGLNSQDLVLACACRIGRSSAWDEFVTRYRPKLYRAALTLTHDEVKARELADSLFADLYGLEQQDGVRRSLLAYFYGRSSLNTWLRAVLAQRFVNSHRSEQRISRAEMQFTDVTLDIIDPPDPNRASYINALSQALTIALGELRPADRMRLNFYYVESLTLKEISRLMREHESTVSRRLARTRAQLRKRVDRTLRREMQYSEDQIRLCYDYANEDGLPDLGQLFNPKDKDRLSGENISPARANN